MGRFDTTTKAGTTTGTMLTILANISSADLLKTCILAATGAIVSFLITLLLKYIARRFQR